MKQHSMNRLWRNLLVWVVMATVGHGCARSFDARAQGWVLVETDHIRLRTDLPSRRATEIAVRMQQTRDAFATAVLRCAFDNEPDPIEVTVFAREREFSEIAGPRLAGRFSRGSSDVGIAPRILLPARLGPENWRTFQHELVHRLIHGCMPSAPSWLHEGLAGVLETARFSNQTLIVGELAYVFGPIGVSAVVYNGHSVGVLPRHVLPAVRDLIAMPAQVFYAQSDQRVLYGASWALAHLLEFGAEELHDPFLSYLEALSDARADPVKAWEDAFAGIDVQAHLDRYILQNEYTYLTIPHRPVPRDAPRAAAMTVGEAHLLWAQLWWSPSNTARDFRARQHARAAARHPNSADLAHRLLQAR